jgi:OOP family OmpA-OmpF porin
MNLQFASGSAYIAQQFYPELDEVAVWMTRYPEYRFFIAGYTDEQGSDVVNEQLSAERARSVKDYLVSKGVKAANILTEGFGSENPLENKWKSSKNRRVEIYLYAVNRLSKT